MSSMPAQPTGRPWLRVIIVLIILVGVAGLWHHMFVMTGIVGDQPDEPVTKLPPPPPPEIEPVSTDWVDLDAYLRTHPKWEP